MGFKKQNNSNHVRPKGERFELLEHKNGQIGMVVSDLDAKKEVKVVIFDENCKTNYGGWRLEDTRLSEETLIISNP